MAKFSIKKWRKKAIQMFGKARGLSARARAQVTKAVRGGGGGKTYKSKTSTVKQGKRMGKRRSFLSVSTIMRFVRLGALIGPGVIEYQRSKRWGNVLELYTGISPVDGKFRWGFLMQGWMPYIVTALLTHGIQKMTGTIRRI